MEQEGQHNEKETATERDGKNIVEVKGKEKEKEERVRDEEKDELSGKNEGDKETRKEETNGMKDR